MFFRGVSISKETLDRLHQMDVHLADEGRASRHEPRTTSRREPAAAVNSTINSFAIAPPRNRRRSYPATPHASPLFPGRSAGRDQSTRWF